MGVLKLKKGKLNSIPDFKKSQKRTLLQRENVLP